MTARARGFGVEKLGRLATLAAPPTLVEISVQLRRPQVSAQRTTGGPGTTKTNLNLHRSDSRAFTSPRGGL